MRKTRLIEILPHIGCVRRVVLRSVTVSLGIAGLMGCAARAHLKEGVSGAKGTGGSEYLVEVQPWVKEHAQFADSVAKILGGRVGWVYKSFKGFSIWLPSDSASCKLSEIREVKKIEIAKLGHPAQR
jgi:hypothetical protein